jgi:hypothetical protein
VTLLVTLLVTRLARRALIALGMLVAFAAPAALRAQSSGVRFEITNVGDSTITFATGRADWVKKGLNGLAIDPRQRDVLVARFEVLEVREGAALAVITGATRPLSTDDVAVLDEPAPSLVRQRRFWAGVLAGALAGVGLGRAL